jgi:hypothetical protein
MRYDRMCSLVVLAAILAVLPACQQEEPFIGGVAIAVEEAFVLTPTAQTGIPFVSTAGSATNGDAFVGITDDNGFDQHPSASLNTTWSVQAFASIANSACPNFSNTQFVGSNGALFRFLCLL